MEQIQQFKALLIGFRKLTFGLILLSITTICLAMGLLSSEDYALIWAATGPAYMAASLAEHITQKTMEKKSRGR